MTIGTVGGLLIAFGLFVLFAVHINLGLVMLFVGGMLYGLDIIIEIYHKFKDTFGD